jgi:DNA-binding response OmpR family regulator
VGASVLIVDEDVRAWNLVGALLRHRGFAVQTVTDGSDACEIARCGSTSVVVVDLSVPGMNGFEVLRRLRSRFGALPLPTQLGIVVVTERTDPEVERFVLRLGADAFVQKPVEPRAFMNLVERLIGRIAPRGRFDLSALRHRNRHALTTAGAFGR